jgi:DNA-binding NarL/FixJ family response regulator
VDRFTPGEQSSVPHACQELGLTERQAQVLARIAQGKPNKVICRELNLAVGTVKIHVSAVLKALKVSNRTQAAIAVRALERSPVDP